MSEDCPRHHEGSVNDKPHELASRPLLAEGEPIDWRQAHEELSRLAKSRARLDWEEARWLVLALRSGAHVALGFATFAEYIERLFGYKPRWTSERLRVAEALEELPQLRQALRDGALSWSAVRELTRVAVPDNELQWLGVTRGRSLRQIEELVSGHQLGDAPGEPSEPSSSRHVLRFEVSAETLSTFREAMAKLRRDSGGPLDDDGTLLLMARHVLQGPTDAGRSSYQIAVTVCDECHRAWQQGAGGLVAVDASVMEMSFCDAQQIGRVPLAASTASAAAAIPQVEGHTHVGSDLGGEQRPSNGADRRSVDRREPGSGTAAQRRLVDDATLEAFEGSDLSPEGHESSRTRQNRARQDIPPAVRRHVMRRDNSRCVVPGCRNGVFVDIHHVRLRSEGGDHDPDELVILCSAHHRATHRGQLTVEGRVSTGLAFRHADGSRYGVVAEPRVAEAHAQAFRALRALGFREDQTRRALERVRNNAAFEPVQNDEPARNDGAAGGGSTKAILLAALGILSGATQHRVISTVDRVVRPPDRSPSAG